MLKPGDMAPDFELPDADMEIVRLSDYRNEQNVVLYFYVRDNTPGCTVEAIEFSDLEADFSRLGWVVLGVSRDDCISHGAFRDKHGISVRLLADKELQACRDFGVMVRKEVDGVMRDSVQRSTFVIDRKGVIRHALYGVAAKGHAADVLQLTKGI
ncbi:MAG: peroxiredoxin [Parasulfuritortus sp.]|jgi:peroxiredoxin Q/BCP|nr:peroxiredoxin [Parasulfuritortus sp.]